MVHGFRLIVVRKALELYLKGIKVNSSYTLTSMLRTVSTYTKVQYKRSKSGALAAIKDLSDERICQIEQAYK